MKRINPTFLKYAIGAVAILVVGCLVMCGQNRKDYTPVATSEERFDNSAARFDSLRNVNGQLVADNEVLKADKIELQALADHYFRMKDKKGTDTKTLTAVTAKGRRDTVYIPYGRNIAIPQISVGRSDSIGVPQHFSYLDSTSAIYGRILKDGLMIDSSYQTVSIYLRTGSRPTGWFSREDFVQAISPNPNVTFTGLASMSYKQRLTWYQRHGKYIVGAIAGAAGTYYLMR